MLPTGRGSTATGLSFASDTAERPASELWQDDDVSQQLGELSQPAGGALAEDEDGAEDEDQVARLSSNAAISRGDRSPRSFRSSPRSPKRKTTTNSAGSVGSFRSEDSSEVVFRKVTTGMSGMTHRTSLSWLTVARRATTKLARPVLKRSYSGLPFVRSRSSGAQSKVVVELIPLDELGVEFQTRARDANDGYYDQSRCRACRNTAAYRKLEHVSPDQVILQLLRWSAAFSCTYVIGALAVESACIAPGSGSALRRLSTSSWRLEAALAVVHAVNALLYAAVVVYRLRVRPMKDVTTSDVVHTDYRSAMQLMTRLAVAQSQAAAGEVGVWFDLVALGGVVAELGHLAEGTKNVPTAAQCLMLLQLAKAWRITSGASNGLAQQNSFARGVLRLFFVLAFWSHVMGCTLLLLSTLERSWGSQSWSDELRSKDATCGVMYVESLYFAVLSLASVGYSDSLVTPGEHGLNSLFLMLGSLYAAKVCADLTWLTTTYNFTESQYQARRSQMWAALQKMHVPTQLATRVLAYQSYMAASNREDLAQAAFMGVSTNLMEELRIVAYRMLVLQAPFLRTQSKEALGLIVRGLRDKVYLPLDVIVRAGDNGRELFFLKRGEAGVYQSLGLEGIGTDENPQLSAYTVGSYFGELGMLTGNKRSAWVVAASYCICSVLPYTCVETLTQEFPGAFTTLVQALVQRYNLKPSVNWQEINNRIFDKLDVDDLEEAFAWFCSLDGYGEEEELSARNFDEGMRRLKVPELDRKIFWAEMDDDNSGLVNWEEFKQVLGQYDRGDESPTRINRLALMLPQGALGDLSMTPKESNGSASWAGMRRERMRKLSNRQRMERVRTLRMRNSTRSGTNTSLTGSPTHRGSMSPGGRRASPTGAAANVLRNSLNESEGSPTHSVAQEQASPLLLQLVLEVQEELTERREQFRQLELEVAKLQAPEAQPQPPASGWVADDPR